MPNFDYHARSPEGKTVNGQIAATNMEAAADRLYGNGLIPVNISSAAPQGETLLARLKAPLARRRPTIVDLRVFTRQMYTLTKAGVEQIDPLGEPFDPQVHEAMTMVPNPDAEPNSVMDVMQKGYRLNGRLVRAAKVIVVQS